MFGGMWTEVKTQGDSPTPRVDHSMCASDDGKNIYVFGGQTYNKVFDDLWSFEISSSTWKKLESSTPGPAGKWGSTLCYHQEKLYLFGGEQTSYNDAVHLFIYSLTDGKWEIPEQGGSAPQARAHHTANIIPIDGGKGMLVYAGMCINTSRELADIRVLNLQNMEWFNPYYAKHGGSEPEEIPPMRKKHTAVLDGNKLLVYAGWQGNRNAGSYWSDFYRLDLDTMIWENPSTRGVTPEPRARHVSAAFNDKLFVWGGMGSAGRGNFGELCYLELDDFTWNRYRRGKPPAERFSATSVLIDGYLWVFGGQLDPDSKDSYVNEMWKAKLSSVY